MIRVKMSIVRSSKFRHVFAEVPKTPDKLFSSVKINKGPWEGNMSSVNAKFLAVCMEAGGGGSFIVLCIDKVAIINLAVKNVLQKTNHVHS